MIRRTVSAAFLLRDAFTGESVGKKTDFFNPTVAGHDMKLYLCRMVPAHG